MAIDCITREMAMSMPWANGQYDHEHANGHFICGLETYKEWLECVPAADVRPVVHGKWKNTESDIWKCSVCGYGIMPWNAGVNYCPNCGADMRKEED